MKKLIFKFFLFFFYFISEIHANDISIHYEKVKDQISVNNISESGDYYFTGSFRKYGSIDSILRESSIDSNELQFDSIPSNLSFDARGRANPTLISITPVRCGTTNPRRDIDVTFAGYIDITRCSCETVPCP